MKASTIALRYSQAVLALATDRKQHEQIGRELDRIATLFAGSDELRALSRNPKFRVSDRKAIVSELLTTHGITGPLVMDAKLAALAIEYHGVIVSWDNDFARFPGLRWRKPF
jgi:F0F1-type ATP synthase delta subunit